MKEGEIISANQASLESKKRASNKVRLVTRGYDNLIEMPKIEYTKGRKTPKY